MRTIIHKESIQYKIIEMANEIDNFYFERNGRKKLHEPIVVIGVLTGAIFFMADLVRHLSIPVEMDFIRISTYPGKATIAQTPKIITPPTNIPHDANILLVDDILDTGKTLEVIKEHLSWFYPASIRIAVLLRKPNKSPNYIKADFVGFNIPDEFVVGMGLDYNGKYRERPDVSVLEGK